MKRRIPTGAAALALPLLLAASAAAQPPSDDLKQEIEALKRGQQQIQQQLAELKRLVQQGRQPAPSGPNVAGKTFNLAANPVKGEPGARLTLIEFLDYQ